MALSVASSQEVVVLVSRFQLGIDSMKSAFDIQVRQPYLFKLIQNLRDRFPAVEIISALSIFNPFQLTDNESELNHYGESEPASLLSNYSSGPLALSSEDALEEWENFKVFASNNSDLEVGSIKDLAAFFLSTPERMQLFPTLSELIVRGLLFTIASADCERAFSAMNRIKTSPCNRLKAKTLEQLMYISIEGPPPDKFDIARAADDWGKRGNRRIIIL